MNCLPSRLALNDPCAEAKDSSGGQKGSSGSAAAMPALGRTLLGILCIQYRFAIRDRNGLSNLNSAPNTPAIDEGSRKSRVEEVNGERVIHDPTRPRGCHRPGVSTAILVEPCRHLIELAAESLRWNCDPDPNSKSRFEFVSSFLR